MKDSKRIDNKMKAKRLAAYTLATCMTVTVAPIGAVTPVMAEEVQVETPILAIGETVAPNEITVEVANTIKPGMKFSDAVNKITLKDIATGDNIGILTSNAITICNKDGQVIFSSLSDTPDTDIGAANREFEVGKTYIIKATFDVSSIIPDAINKVNVSNDGATVTPSGLPVTDKITMTNYKLDMTNGSSAAKLDDYATEKEGSTPIYYYRNGKGEIVKETTVAQNKDGWFYVKDGKKDTPGATSLIVENGNGKWLVNTGTGEVTFNKTGLAEDADGNVWYVKNSKVDTTMTGFYAHTQTDTDSALLDGTYYIKDGKMVTDLDVVQNPDDGKWYRIYHGQIVTGSTGFAKNAYGTWFIKMDGSVDFDKNGVERDGTGVISTVVRDYYIANGKVDFNKNGLIFITGAGLFNVKNGIVDTTTLLGKETVAQDPTTGDWYAINKDGIIDKSVTFAKNDYGTWVVDDDGKVMFGATGLLKDVNGEISSDKTKVYYVKDGKVVFDKTGFVDYTADTIYPNSGSTLGHFALHNGTLTGTNIKYNIENGVVTAKKADDCVVQDKDGGVWRYVDTNGVAPATVTSDNTNATNATYSLAANKYGVWAIKNADGTVDFKATEGFYRKVDATATDSLFYTKDGSVQATKTGWATVSTDRRYVKNGEVVKPEKSTVLQADDGKWYYADKNKLGGKDGSPYTGFAINNYGTWWVDADVVTFKKEGAVQDSNAVLSGDKAKWYYVSGSKLSEAKSGLFDTGSTNAVGDLKYFENGKVAGRDAKDSVVHYAPTGAWYSIKNDGTVDTTNNGLAANSVGIWKVTSGAVQFSGAGSEQFYTVQTADEKVGAVKAGTEIYIKGGKFQSDVTGLVTIGIRMAYVKNGVVTTTGATDILQGPNGDWYFVEDGVVNYGFTGLAKNANGTWYVQSGKVNFNKTGIVEKLPGSEDLYYVEGGQMKGDRNGLISVGTTKCFVKDSKLTGKELKDSVVNGNDGKWYYVGADGIVDTTFNLYAGNSNGVWKINNGVVDFTYNAVATVGSTDGVAALGDRKALTASKDAYFVNGCFKADADGIAVVGTNYYNLKAGYVDNTVFTTMGATSEETVVLKGLDGKLYAVQLDSGVVKLVTTEGMAKYGDDYCYVNGGLADLTMTGIVNDTHTDKWSALTSTTYTPMYYVEKGILKTDVTDIIAFRNERYNVVAGQVIAGTSTNNIYSDKAGNKFYIGSDGKVTVATGIGQDSAGNLWYIKDGKVDTTFTKASYTPESGAPGDGHTYKVINGVASATS